VETIATSEIIKYLFNTIIGIGGAYVVLVVKGIGKDIAGVSKDITTLKEFFLVQIKTLEASIGQHRLDIQELYDLQRRDKERMIQVEAELKALKEEHNRRHGGSN